MIENIRKYSGVIMITLVVSALAFILGDYNRSSQAFNGGQPMLRIDGRTYNDKEFRTLGQGGYELVSGLAQSGDFSLYQFLMPMTAGATSKDDVAENFFVSRMLLRQAKDDFGVYPGEQEISDYLKNSRVFMDENETFSAEKFNNFVEHYMGRLGMTEKDLRELVSDVLAARKINEIVGAGLASDRDAAARNLALQSQRITGEVAKLELAPFEAKLDPKEDEIRTYWENVRDAFKTEPKRKFTYIIATPEAPAEVKDEPAPEPPVDPAASEEEKKAAAKKKEEEQSKRAAEAANARRARQLETDQKVDDFLFRLEEQKGAGFEELAKEYKWEVKTTELFARTAAPKELDVNLRSSSRGGKAVDNLFQITETSDAFSKISEAIAIGENQWIVARLDAEEKSRDKTYEEARTEARAQYISEKAADALKTAANEAVTKINEALKAGKSFAEAAKEAGIETTRAFTSITSAYRPDGADEPGNLFEAARNIDPGTVAEPIIESDRAFILFVAKREVVKDDIAAAKIETEIKSRNRENENMAFMSWISARTDAAKVEQLYKQP